MRLRDSKQKIDMYISKLSRNVWTKEGSHYSLQSDHLSYGSTRILSSSLHTIKTKFCVGVDDFGVKYFSKDDANNLPNDLKKQYEISTYWEGTIARNTLTYQCHII